jgi:hypothetical protein
MKIKVMIISVMSLVFLAGSAWAGVAPKYSCVGASPSKHNYFLRINVFETTMQVLQSSEVARYAPLNFSLQPQTPTAPTENPVFTCINIEPGTNNYTVRINVFKNAVQILQSSATGRFAPLQYSIAPL